MRSILVVDDRGDVGSFISMALISFGFSIRFARDGGTALDMIEECEPDLIICNVDLPGMDGYGLLSSVRHGKTAAKAPFILISGTITPDGFRKAAEGGADDYLVKPFNPDALVDLALSLMVRRAEQDAMARTLPAAVQPASPPRKALRTEAEMASSLLGI